MSRRGHHPIRMCSGCRTRRKKAEMIRFTRIFDGGQMRLIQSRQGGRGIYLCPDPSCLKAARKKLGLGAPGDADQFQNLFKGMPQISQG